ncbi:hypothetical protein Tco_0088820 [Tanacetum coccineum]
MVHNHYLEEAKNKTHDIGTSINVQEERTLDLNAGTPFNLKKERIKVHKHVIQESYGIILVIVARTSDDPYVLTNKMKILLDPASTSSCIIPNNDGDGDASFQLESDSLPHAHAQTTKTYYKHQDSRIMKAQELKTKTSIQTLIYKIFLQRYQVYQGRLLASFQDDAKYEHVGQDTRSQGGKDDQDERIKI